MRTRDELVQLRAEVATDHNLDWRTALARLLDYAIGDDESASPPPAATPDEPLPAPPQT